MKILFIGCVESSYRLLLALLENGNCVTGVITKRESEFNSDFYDLAPLCNKYNIEVLYTKNINDNDSIHFIKKQSPDIGFCFGWSQLIKEEVIDIFPKGIVGFHPAQLPNNKGRHPLIWALVLGLEETASTFFMLDSGADTGAIISQAVVPISYDDDATSLYNKIMDVAVKQELQFVKELEDDTVNYIVQSSVKGNSWRKRNRKDGIIDWRMSSYAIYNLVRGLTHPYVGAAFEYQGKEYKVWKAKEIVCSDDMGNIEPGKVIKINRDGTIDIKVYDNVVRLIDFDTILVKEGDYL
ncbi:formyl transferase [bacterium D16-51]|nr:formyl transferase [bacterium D16-59]RKI55889.1 formyl transferase [bacterium D16-51]